MKRHPFNLIEILLALGVIAIGICSVMVLFPVGANAARDTAMETYAASAAEQMLAMVKYKITQYDETNHKYFWNEYVCAEGAETGSLTAKASKPTDSDISGIDELLDLSKASEWNNSSDLLNGNALQGGIYSDTSDMRFYQLVAHRGDSTASLSTIAEHPDLIDFRALGVLWTSKVDFDGTDLPYSMAVRLNLELSWPVELPYTRRQKSYYTLEVFK